MDWTETFPPWVLFAVVALAGVLLVVVLALIARRSLGDSFPYRRRATVLTPEEHALRQALQQAVGDRALLLPKLRVADVLSVRTNVPRRRASRARNRIATRYFDFVLCAPADTQPLVAVELDRSQDAGQRRRHDRFLDEACNAAGLGLLRVSASDEHAMAELGGRLRPYLERGETARAGDLTPDGRREPILDLPVE